MSMRRAALLIVIVAVATYLTALGNGFAMDDVPIVRANPVVTTPHWGQALTGPYWPIAREGAGLYRPVVTTSFAAEWLAFGGEPLAFHVISVVTHVVATLLVLALLWGLVPPLAALAGALLFAVHPVHVEAVANVVGRSELYAGVAVLAASILYLQGASWDGPRRAGRLAGICVLYLLGMGSKESAAVLPALLLLLELVRRSPMDLRARLRHARGVYVSLAAVLATYLLLRTAVLGTVSGEVPAPWLRGLGWSERWLVALAVWPELARLLFFPLDLASDYAPDVVHIPTAVDAAVVAGAAVLVGAVTVAWKARRELPLLSVGIAWFVIAVLPVSNLLVPAGLLMAERTLYLPSVGFSVAVAGVMAWIQTRARRPVFVFACSLVLATTLLLAVRSAARNPSWRDSSSVINTLATQHPESYVSLRARAGALAARMDTVGAAAAYDSAVALAPMLYGLRVEVAEFHGSRGHYRRATDHLVEAVRLRREQPQAYMLLSEYLIRQGQGRGGHRVAVTGLARSGPRRQLFALLSESYVAKGDLEGAIRARRAALGQAPSSAADWGRLAELLDAMGRTEDARAARARADVSG